MSDWWPAVLILIGIVLLVLFLLSRRPPDLLPPVPVQEPALETPVVAPVAPVAPPATQQPFMTQEPAPLAPAEEQPADIYDVLAEQPPEPKTDDEPWG